MIGRKLLTEDQQEAARARSRAYYRANKDRINAASKAKYHSDPERKSNYHRKRAYKMTNEELEEFLTAHKGLCDICGVDGDLQGFKSMCIDHDHVTGKVRGLLCRRCNLGLHFIENLEWASKADAYLKQHKEG